MRTPGELLDRDMAIMLVTALPLGLWFLWLALVGAWNDWSQKRE